MVQIYFWLTWYKSVLGRSWRKLSSETNLWRSNLRLTRWLSCLCWSRHTSLQRHESTTHRIKRPNNVSDLEQWHDIGLVTLWAWAVGLPAQWSGWHPDTFSVQFSSIQDGVYIYICALKSPYALHPVSQKFPQSCLWYGSNVRLIDDGPLLSFQGRLSSTSEFIHFPPFQVLSMFIDSLVKWSIIVCAGCSSQQDAMSSAPESKRCL